ncbi:TonB-dependent receptor [Brevundimonas sp.]|uniref:TonB-dependent receptor domain-containing protein n=1 Tax=Brevundimonas sp. TaxID=1871086 RepID=UPI002489F76C|nr:TonB-dependent receptor [Brevundimonas sp.]MDI1282259.1 TonB-dependent receptor [Brevundimonas sp.]
MLLSAGSVFAQSAQDWPEDADRAPDEPLAVLGDIVITGTSIRGVPPTGSNLITVSRDDIRTLGAANTPDLLASVPQLNSFNTAPSPSLGGVGSFAPGLRGLPANATLPLMNGHRLVAAAANETNPDFPLIPILAVERVEVIADGASSIYGSDAVAGVVNFITRRNVSGAEVSANYGMADNYRSAYVSALLGHSWGSGSILAAYQYTENDNVVAGDRDYRMQDFRPFGGIDTRGVSCPSANVLVNTTFYSVYYAAPALASNTRNYCDNGAVADLYPKTRVHSLFVSGRQDLGANAALWGELLYSDRRDEIRVAPPVQTVVLLASNPFFRAPPGTGATIELVQFRPDNLIGDDHFTNTDDRKVLNSSAGVDMRLPRDFDLSVYGTFARAENVAFLPSINAAALAAAAAGTSSATALDPFGTGTAPSVVAGILNSSTSVTIDQRSWLGAVRLTGPLMELPGGSLKVAVGAEFRRETFDQEGFVGATPVPESLTRDITSVYGELFIPIVGAANAAPFIRSLSLSLSGRYDDYSDFGSTTNPKVGISWKPVDDVALRASYGQSFRAPGMRQVGATVGAYYLDAATSAVAANDPTRGAAQVATIYLLGGNSLLQPEEATTWSFGADWHPAFLPNLRTSLTYYNIDYTNVIGTPSVALVFTDPTFSAIVHRNPTPTELAGLLSIAVPVNLPTPLPTIGNFLDLRLNNFGVRKTDGLDADINYTWPTSFGAVYADLAGNYVLNFDTQLSPAAPVSNALDLGVARATVRGTLGIETGSLSLAGFVNYRDGVRNNFTTPTGVSSYKADAYTTVDLRVTWRLADAGWSKGTSLALQVNDLFDQEPPFFPATDGIGGSYNPIGRFVALNLRKTF